VNIVDNGREKVSCIVPAYNEAERIASVLDVICETNLINEIIVINDGSSDNTSEVVRRYEDRLTFIDLPENKGKAYALKCGLGAATGQVILLLDADLQGLQEKNIAQLLDPVLEGRADMTLSLRKNSLFIYRVLGVDLISGERAIHKEVLENLQNYENSRFGFETILNDYVVTNRLSFESVHWDNVKVAPKSEKRGFLNSIVDEMKMMGDIMDAVPINKLFYIFFKMSIPPQNKEQSK
jgi:glycosyltransferase involved in cell wall biosynthesis